MSRGRNLQQVICPGATCPVGRLVKMATSPRGDTSLGRQIWVRNVQEAICSGDETFQGVTFSETQSFN